MRKGVHIDAPLHRFTAVFANGQVRVYAAGLKTTTDQPEALTLTEFARRCQANNVWFEPVSDTRATITVDDFGATIIRTKFQLT
jgi:hypothetical protein